MNADVATLLEAVHAYTGAVHADPLGSLEAGSSYAWPRGAMSRAALVLDTLAALHAHPEPFSQPHAMRQVLETMLFKNAPTLGVLARAHVAGKLTSAQWDSAVKSTNRETLSVVDKRWRRAFSHVMECPAAQDLLAHAASDEQRYRWAREALAGTFPSPPAVLITHLVAPGEGLFDLWSTAYDKRNMAVLDALLALPFQLPTLDWWILAEHIEQPTWNTQEQQVWLRLAHALEASPLQSPPGSVEIQALEDAMLEAGSLEQPALRAAHSQILQRVGGHHFPRQADRLRALDRCDELATHAPSATPRRRRHRA